MVRIQSGSLVAQSNCAIFRLKAALEEGFRKKAFQAVSNQIKENGALFGALILWGTRGNLKTCFVVMFERVFKKLKNYVV